MSLLLLFAPGISGSTGTPTPTPTTVEQHPLEMGGGLVLSHIQEMRRRRREEDDEEVLLLGLAAATLIARQQ